MRSARGRGQSAEPVYLLATAQPQRLWPLTGPPRPTSEQPRPARSATPQDSNSMAGEAERSRAEQGVQLRGQTHRVQLPLEYDEGHKANNDKNRAETQVGKEVAREITCGRQRSRHGNRSQPLQLK